MTTDVLAIVGSTWFSDRTALAVARSEILGVFERRRPDVVVSGGAEGIDTLGVALARARGIVVREHKPQVRRWDGPGGFEERNLLIARDCGRILRIACRWSPTFGSGWTYQKATEFGARGWDLVLPRTVAAGTIWAPLGRATLGAIVRDGIVVDVPPYAKRLGWKGRHVDGLMRELRKKRVRAVWLPDGAEAA
ncbi:hypothetical protein ACIBTV_27065 [Micromonospora sp. NPDC049366]|uniref:hypothetical protein n=1 Tax=Micromonospora sp. NPDC049366 TaxID=3364271 RepID=UPI0037A9D582